MATVARLREYLDSHGILYTVIAHSKAYTAQQVAAITHVPGKDLAKTVIVKHGDQLAMVVVPAPHNVDLEALSGAIGADVRLASEAEFGHVFPECEVGAMPPFGNLWGVPVWVAEALTRDDEIVFNAGTHTDVIRMKLADFARLVQPRVADCSRLTMAPPRVEPMG